MTKVAPLKELSLFTGIGGFSYSLRGVLQPILYCEIDPFCQKVLRKNMQRKNIGEAPIVSDVQSITKRSVPEQPDILTAGFPCQDISCLGPRAGIHGSRSGLFFELIRIVQEVKPKLIFLENVARIVHNGLHEVLTALHRASYDCRWTVISAADLGASHLRSRWYLLAKRRSCTDVVVNYDSSLLPSWREEKSTFNRLVTKSFPNQLARCGAIGNAVAPRCARFAFYYLLSMRQPNGAKCSWSDGKIVLSKSETRASGNILPSHGFSVQGKVYEYPALKFPPHRKLDLVVVPPKPPKVSSTKVSRPLAIGKYRFSRWPTPCKNGNEACAKTVTDYQIHCLKTVLLHERNSPKIPDGRVGPVFLEWLMGFPSNYTLVPHM